VETGGGAGGFPGARGGRGAVLYTELLEDPLQMFSDRAPAQGQDLRDFGVGLAPGHPGEHFRLPPAQPQGAAPGAIADRLASRFFDTRNPPGAGVLSFDGMRGPQPERPGGVRRASARAIFERAGPRADPASTARARLATIRAMDDRLTGQTVELL